MADLDDMYTRRSIKKKARVEKRYKKAIGKTMKTGAKLEVKGAKLLSKANKAASDFVKKTRKTGELMGTRSPKIYKLETRAGLNEKVGKAMQSRPANFVNKKETAKLKVKRRTPLHGSGGKKSVTLRGRVVKTKKK